jgi:hypothetical protein
VPSTASGIDLRGQVRDIVSFKKKNEDCILFLENNDYPVSYKIK